MAGAETRHSTCLPVQRKADPGCEDRLSEGVPSGGNHQFPASRSPAHGEYQSEAAGVDAMTAMKIVGHKSEHMHRRYNTVQPEDLRRAVSHSASYQTNTVITPGSLSYGAENPSACFSNVRP